MVLFKFKLLFSSLLEIQVLVEIVVFPLSILLFIFNGKRQQFYQNIYHILGQALIPITMVALFFIVLNN